VTDVSEPPSYLEVILEVVAGGDREHVVGWARERGLTAATMVVGVVVGGEVPRLLKAFGVPPTDLRPGGRLPVPVELRDHVAIAHVVEPRHLHLPPM
jgi:hypothetical protein